MSLNISDIKQLHIETPLILSSPLSKLCGRNVYLKLDNLQPSGMYFPLISNCVLKFLINY